MPDHAALFRNAADALENPQDEHGLDLARLIDQLREAAKVATVTASTATLATAESALQFVFDACARLNDSEVCATLRSAAESIREEADNSDDPAGAETFAANLESTVDSLAEELTDMQNNAGRALATIRGETAEDDDENPFARDPATGGRKVPLGMPAKES